MTARNSFLLTGIGSLAILVLGGCGRHAPQAAPPEATVVPLSRPVDREVTDYVDFTGNTQAVNSVNVLARVTGYLENMPFKEGSEVKAGDVLFEIDARPYQAQYDQAFGQVNLYKAQLKLAEANLARDVQLAHNTPGSVSAQQVDTDRAAVDEAVAQVKAAEASLEVYKLNLNFTKVAAPIDGQVSRFYLTAGNLVSQDQTVLTTVVSLDPICVYFDVDEPTVLRVRKAINNGQITPYANGAIPVYMGLTGEEGFPRTGRVDFVNNQFSSSTGSILVRGVFDNPLPLDDGGPFQRAWDVLLHAVFPGTLPPNSKRRLLLPGMFARIRLPIGQPQRRLLVIDRAIGSDQGNKFVYVVKADSVDQNKVKGKVQYRRIATGALQTDGLRVITNEGLKADDGVRADDLIVVGGLQQVGPHMDVQGDIGAMPTLNGAAP